MIKVIPIQGTKEVIISHRERPVRLDILKIDVGVLTQLAELAHSIEDNNGHKISTINYEGGKIIFSRLTESREIPAYVENFPLQPLRECLKELELTIVEKWDELFEECK